MPKSILKGLILIVVIAFISGCSTRTYTVVKDREDQEMLGNAGYLGGTPPPGAKDTSKVRKTRKTYVLEVQTPGSKKQEQEAEALMKEAEEIAERARRTNINIPKKSRPSRAEKIEAAPKVTTSTVEYTVGKNDTLQKISMKFYDTNHKWQKIYEANKDVIKNPQRIKPGMVLRIPQE